MKTRTIKFRIWNPVRKEMSFLEEGYLECYVAVGEECIPMQFTGLLDSKGKEIYEHDIIQLSKDGRKTSFPLIVRYFEPLARFILHRNMDKIKFINDIDKNIEQINYEDKKIIGNIYENSRFLVTSEKSITS